MRHSLDSLIVHFLFLSGIWSTFSLFSTSVIPLQTLYFPFPFHTHLAKSCSHPRKAKCFSLTFNTESTERQWSGGKMPINCLDTDGTELVTQTHITYLCLLSTKVRVYGFALLMCVPVLLRARRLAVHCHLSPCQF